MSEARRVESAPSKVRDTLMACRSWEQYKNRCGDRGLLIEIAQNLKADVESDKGELQGKREAGCKNRHSERVRM